MAWTEPSSAQGRRRGIAAAVLACVLALMVVVVVNETVHAPSTLQQTCTGSFCQVKAAALWAKTVIAKVTAAQHPVFVVPDISAAEQGVEAASAASRLFKIKIQKTSNTAKVPASVSSSTSNSAAISPFNAASTISPVNAASQQSEAVAESSTPADLQSIGQQVIDLPSGGVMQELPPQTVTSSGAEMVEEPLPFNSFSAPIIRRSVSRYAAVSGYSAAQDQNEPQGQQFPLEAKKGYRFQRIVVKFPTASATASAEAEPAAPTESEPVTPTEPEPTESEPVAAATNDDVPPSDISQQQNDAAQPSQESSSEFSEQAPSVENDVVPAVTAQVDLSPTPEQTPTPVIATEVESAPEAFEENPAILWSYHEPASAPDQWGSLGYVTCGQGTNQSPINIESNVEPAELPILSWGIPETSDAFQTGNAAVSAFYNGRTFEVVGLDALMAVDGLQYTLKQLHVHTPSEHKISGQHYEMEIHFVHMAMVDGNARYLIVAALFRTHSESVKFIADIASTLPMFDGGKRVLDIDFANIAMSVLGQMEPVNPTVTNAQNYFQYQGSFTAPPCDEGVTWVVLKNALPISHADLSAFIHLEGKNNRPVQALNGRTVFDSHLSQ